MMEEKAVLAGKELAEKLNKSIGGAWEPRVWQNFGWHYAAYLGSMAVYPTINGDQYSTLISNTKGKPGGGFGVWSGNIDTYSSNPAESVRIAMTHAQNETNKLQETLNDNKFLASGLRTIM